MAVLSDMEAGDNASEQQQQSPPVEQQASSSAEKKERLVPNKANGLDMETHTWGQSLQEVTITVPVPPGSKGRFIVCDIKKSHIKIGLKNQPPILEGELFDSVKMEDCFWSLEDQKTVSVLLTKQDRMNWWKSLIKGGPEIDTQKVEPEPSKLSDLDFETRSSVEKMLFDQHQKSLGLPTSDQIQNQELMKKFKDQFPDMDFSGGAKMMGGR
ncbi:hypothetical protein ACH5RR_031826 [Cinchona calisaya]|uniref:CS domain-containing protein n=1 Tax=Cinchona calisaya TaxID=153742 RepID=A0ABD2YGC1_9GENT